MCHVLLDLLDLCLQSGDVAAAESLKRLRPDLLAYDYVKTRTQMTMTLTTRVLRWCITYNYKSTDTCMIASTPIWHFQNSEASIHDIAVHPMATAFRYRTEFVLRGFLWKQDLQTDKYIRYKKAHVAQQNTYFYDVDPRLTACQCPDHHALQSTCGMCELDSYDQMTPDLVSVRRLTRCHHVAWQSMQQDLQYIFCPLYDNVYNLLMIADRPHKTIKYKSIGRIENPLLLPCIATVKLSATFAYYKQIPFSV
jgi:hypothetical protein